MGNKNIDDVGSDMDTTDTTSNIAKNLPADMKDDFVNIFPWLGFFGAVICFLISYLFNAVIFTKFGLYGVLLMLMGIACKLGFKFIEWIGHR